MMKIQLHKTYELPQSWQELPLERLPMVVEMAFLRKTGASAYHDLFRAVLGIPEKEYRKVMNRYFGRHVSAATREKNAEELHSLLLAVRWIWETDLTRRPFEYIEAEGQKWLLPEQGFKTMSWGELSDAFVHSKAYAEQLEAGETRLHLLIATLCRPAQKKRGDFAAAQAWNGDEREPYNEHFVKTRLAGVEKLPAATKAAIYLWFVGTMNEVFGSYELFGDGPAQEEDYPGQSFVRNTFTLAEKGIFGSVPQTRTANLHEVFLFLEENNKRERRKESAQEEAHNYAAN